MSDDGRIAVKSADRVLDLFELLSRNEHGLTHTGIADTLGIPKSSLSQLLKSLLARGYLKFDPSTKCYGLGDQFATLANLAVRRNDILSLVPFFLERITQETGESSAFNILRDDCSEVVATISGLQRLGTHMRLGDRAPLFATSGGKILLAFSTREWRESYLQRVRLTPVTARTISTVEELQRQIEIAQADGVAYSFEEFTPGITGLAVPVMLKNGELAGALNVAIPSARYQAEIRDKAIVALKRSAAEIAQTLG